MRMPYPLMDHNPVKAPKQQHMRPSRAHAHGSQAKPAGHRRDKKWGNRPKSGNR